MAPRGSALAGNAAPRFVECDRSAALAARAEEGGALALHDAPDRRPAARTRLPGPPVDPGVQLERAGHAVRIAEVAQRRAAGLERSGEHGAHRLGQRLATRATDAIGARPRIDAGLEQRLARVDVAGADHD